MPSSSIINALQVPWPLHILSTLSSPSSGYGGHVSLSHAGPTNPILQTQKPVNLSQIHPWNTPPYYYQLLYVYQPKIMLYLFCNREGSSPLLHPNLRNKCNCQLHYNFHGHCTGLGNVKMTVIQNMPLTIVLYKKMTTQKRLNLTFSNRKSNYF